MILSASCHAIDQIAVHRAYLSWLPDWVLNKGGIANLDGFHIIKGMGRVFMAASGAWLLHIRAGWKLFAAWWVLEWQLFDAFYHAIFMRAPECWPCDQLKEWLALLGRIF